MNKIIQNENTTFYFFKSYKNSSIERPDSFIAHPARNINVTYGTKFIQRNQGGQLNTSKETTIFCILQVFKNLRIQSFYILALQIKRMSREQNKRQ